MKKPPQAAIQPGIDFDKRSWAAPLLPVGWEMFPHAYHHHAYGAHGMASAARLRTPFITLGEQIDGKQQAADARFAIEFLAA
uniref:DnaJ-domain-containing protein n=1 Tax=Aureimonas altamirensis TaxID=370622 RepID=A0A0P0YWH1_9HYPH|nr:DnaJ-domain-containing protein [Aureimonas altamirensis]